MLNEVRRKPEKPRVSKFPGLGYECEGAGIYCLANSRAQAYRDWKKRYDQQTKAKSRA
jgi:hypothetical protein